MEESEENISQDKLQEFGYRLRRLIDEQVGIRQQIEDRWINNLRQYKGLYDAKTLSNIEKNKGSKAFLNITRAKTIATESRLIEMLFPSDDRNWALQPTPVPELQKMAGNQNTFVAEQAKAIINMAQTKSEAMQREIDDQLTEASYQQIARMAIHEACVFGTGVIKGPVVVNRMRKQWKPLRDAVHVLDMANEYRPGVEHVSIWDFFPDMVATSIEECDFILERRYVTKKQLVELAKRPGYMADQIRLVVADSSEYKTMRSSTHISKIREMSGLNTNLDEKRYELWCYSGVIEREELEACGCEIEDELEIYTGIVEVINGRVIRADINPLETGELNYSIFNYEEDEASIFGIGIPEIMENEQRIINASWRMALDNAALCTKPQYVINDQIVDPADGDWALKPGKGWRLTDPNRSVDEVFRMWEINSHQDELLNLFHTAKSLVDQVTNMPMLAQGEVGDAPDTATGMSMLMNSSNIVLRGSTVKSFDDGITSTLIKRFYDWNMQNSEKEEIKGDFEVDARGSSSLLVKETQTRALSELMLIAQQPPYSEMTKHIELYRKRVQAQHLSPDEIVKTKEEYEADQNSKANPQNDLLMKQIEKLTAEIEKITAEKVNKNMEGMFSAISTAEKAALNPGLMPVADELLLSGGFSDANGGAIASEPQQAMTIPTEQNTHPMYPPNPDVGIEQGFNQ